MTRKLRTTRWLASAAAVTMAGAAAAAPAQADNNWQSMDTGTSDDISAIEYRSQGNLFFTTHTGKVFKLGNKTPLLDTQGGTDFQDLELSPDGSVGFAVGTNGAVYRSSSPATPGSWSAINMGQIAFADGWCDRQGPLGNVSKVAFESPTSVWIAGDTNQLLRTTPGQSAGSVGATPADWQNGNLKQGGGCIMNGDIEDMAFPSPSAWYFYGNSTWFSNTQLVTTPQARSNACSGDDCEVAIDPGQSTKQWSTDSYGYGTETGWTGTPPYFGLSQKNLQGRPGNGMRDIDFAGGTLGIAGRTGLIMTSTNGRDIYHVGPQGDDLTNDWNAVDVLDATHMAVGGQRGHLLLSDQANYTPDIVGPVIDSINGPDTVTAGGSAQFTANVSDAGGVDDSGITWTMGGAVVATGRTVTLSFPRAQGYTIEVNATDKAGNKADRRYKSVSSRAPVVVTPTPTPTPTPEPITVPNLKSLFTGTNKPKAGLVTKKGKRYVKLNIKQKLGVPAGVNPKLACKGTIYLLTSGTKRKKKLNIDTSNAKIASNCSYKKTIQFLRSKIDKPEVTVGVQFTGNQYLKAFSVKGKIKIKKQF